MGSASHAWIGVWLLCPGLIFPGQTYEFRIDLGHTATVFPAGHRIRLQISSSNFPRFARNLNTGESNESTSKTAAAYQVVIHDESHPSRITLPVAPNVSVPPPDTHRE